MSIIEPAAIVLLSMFVGSMIDDCGNVTTHYWRYVFGASIAAQQAFWFLSLARVIL